MPVHGYVLECIIWMLSLGVGSTLKGDEAYSFKIDLFKGGRVEVSGRSSLVLCKNNCLTVIQQGMESFLEGAEKGPSLRTLHAEDSRDVVMWIPEVLEFNWWPPTFLPALRLYDSISVIFHFPIKKKFSTFKFVLIFDKGCRMTLALLALTCGLPLCPMA